MSLWFDVSQDIFRNRAPNLIFTPEIQVTFQNWTSSGWSESEVELWTRFTHKHLCRPLAESKSAKIWLNCLHLAGVDGNSQYYHIKAKYLGHLAFPLTISRLDISWCHNFMSVEAPKYFTLFYREILTFAVNARQVETFKPDFCTSRLSWRSAKVLVGKSCP